MARVLDDLVLMKLSLARQLLSRATAAAGEPGILGPALGVSLSQDALELILTTVADHHRVSIPPRHGFEQIISELGKAGHLVPQSGRLLQINKARVSFKHHGITPEPQLAKKLVAFASIGADEICQECLGTSLWSVSSNQLVLRTRVRNHLNEALRLKDAEDFEGSVTSSAISFALTFGPLTNTRSRMSRQSSSPSSFGWGVSAIERGDSLRDTARSVERAIASLAAQVEEDLKRVDQALGDLRGQLGSIKLGIDLGQLGRFETLVPNVSFSQAGTIHLTRAAPGERSVEDAEFAFDFAFDAIIRGQGPLTDQQAKEWVVALRESPIVVWPTQPPDSPEMIRMAQRGDRLTRPSRRFDHEGFVQILFEGDRAYIAAEHVGEGASDPQILPIEGSPT